MFQCETLQKEKGELQQQLEDIKSNSTEEIQRMTTPQRPAAGASAMRKQLAMVAHFGNFFHDDVSVSLSAMMPMMTAAGDYQQQPMMFMAFPWMFPGGQMYGGTPPVGGGANSAGGASNSGGSATNGPATRAPLRQPNF